MPVTTRHQSALTEISSNVKRTAAVTNPPYASKKCKTVGGLILPSKPKTHLWQYMMEEDNCTGTLNDLSLEHKDLRNENGGFQSVFDDDLDDVASVAASALLCLAEKEGPYLSTEENETQTIKTAIDLMIIDIGYALPLGDLEEVRNAIADLKRALQHPFNSSERYDLIRPIATRELATCYFPDNFVAHLTTEHKYDTINTSSYSAETAELSEDESTVVEEASEFNKKEHADNGANTTIYTMAECKLNDYAYVPYNEKNEDEVCQHGQDLMLFHLSNNDICQDPDRAKKLQLTLDEVRDAMNHPHGSIERNSILLPLMAQYPQYFPKPYVMKYAMDIAEKHCLQYQQQKSMLKPAFFITSSKNSRTPQPHPKTISMFNQYKEAETDDEIFESKIMMLPRKLEGQIAAATITNENNKKPITKMSKREDNLLRARGIVDFYIYAYSTNGKHENNDDMVKAIVYLRSQVQKLLTKVQTGDIKDDTDDSTLTNEINVMKKILYYIAPEVNVPDDNDDSTTSNNEDYSDNDTDDDRDE